MPPFTLLLPQRPLLAPFSLGLGLALTQLHRPAPLLLDSFPSSKQSAPPPRRVPIFKDGRVNPDVYGQISSGSICGVLAGLVVASFSRTLAVLFGLLVFGVQFAASKGYYLPVGRLQRSIKGIDIRSALHDNVAFKLSFALTFMLAAFAEF